MSISRKTVKTTFCLVSDTHDRGPQPADKDQFAFRDPLPSADVFLHAGDLTMLGGLTSYRKVLDWIKSVDAELKIVIAGNHDLDMHTSYWLSHSGEENDVAWQQINDAKELWTGQDARDAGVIYLDEGLNTFRLKNGAEFTIYTSPWQPEFYDWAFNYPRDEDRYNPPNDPADRTPANPIPSWPDVDIMLTHGPPYGILDMTDRGQAVGCEFLLKAVKRVRPRLHCFGHIHEGWGAQRINWKKNSIQTATPQREKMLENRSACLPFSANGEPLVFGEETVFVNASIMNLRYRPVNAPWLVDLDLPVRVED